MVLVKLRCCSGGGNDGGMGGNNCDVEPGHRPGSGSRRTSRILSRYACCNCGGCAVVMEVTTAMVVV